MNKSALVLPEKVTATAVLVLEKIQDVTQDAAFQYSQPGASIQSSLHLMLCSKEK